MAATLDTFREQFPELARYGDDAVARALLTARQMHNVRALATLYCAAHLLTLGEEEVAQPDGGHGEVTSRRVGELATDFQAQAERGRQSFFTTSSYGRMFLTLEQRSSYGLSVRVF